MPINGVYVQFTQTPNHMRKSSDCHYCCPAMLLPGIVGQLPNPEPRWATIMTRPILSLPNAHLGQRWKQQTWGVARVQEPSPPREQPAGRCLQAPLPEKSLWWSAVSGSAWIKLGWSEGLVFQCTHYVSELTLSAIVSIASLSDVSMSLCSARPHLTEPHSSLFL